MIDETNFDLTYNEWMQYIYSQLDMDTKIYLKSLVDKNY